MNVSVAFYGVVIAISVVVQGLTALYYFTRRCLSSIAIRCSVTAFEKNVKPNNRPAVYAKESAEVRPKRQITQIQRQSSNFEQ